MFKASRNNKKLDQLIKDVDSRQSFAICVCVVCVCMCVCVCVCVCNYICCISAYIQEWYETAHNMCWVLTFENFIQHFMQQWWLYENLVSYSTHSNSDFIKYNLYCICIAYMDADV